MKLGLRKRSFKRSVKAMTTGKIKRRVKKSVTPFYGKKGAGLIKDPKKALYNKVYKKTTIQAPGLYSSQYKNKSFASETKPNTVEHALYMWSASETETSSLCKKLDGKVFTPEQIKQLKFQPGEVNEDCDCMWIKLNADKGPKPSYDELPPVLKK